MKGLTEGLTYQEVGATRDGMERTPPGYHPLRVRVRLGEGRAALEAAGEALMGWRMQRAAGLTVRPDPAPPAAPGVRVVMGLGVGRLRLRAPCEVVWTVQERDRVGFAYGTLPGHPECGEEAFVAALDADGSVWLDVTAFSRGAAWYTRWAGPAGRLAQRLAARGYGAALRRLVIEAVGPGGPDAGPGGRQKR